VTKFGRLEGISSAVAPSGMVRWVPAASILVEMREANGSDWNRNSGGFFSSGCVMKMVLYFVRWIPRGWRTDPSPAVDHRKAYNSPFLYHSSVR
jgi:hypothetical protein